MGEIPVHVFQIFTEVMGGTSVSESAGLGDTIWVFGETSIQVFTCVRVFSVGAPVLMIRCFSGLCRGTYLGPVGWFGTPVYIPNDFGGLYFIAPGVHVFRRWAEVVTCEGVKI